MRWLLAVLALAGCDAVFGLRDPDGADARVVQDARADRCAQGGAIEVPVEVRADTSLDDGALPHGSEPVAVMAGAQVMLLGIDAEIAEFEQLTVTLSGASCLSSDGACMPCAATPGGLRVYLVRADWDEATATASVRAGGDQWSAPSAGGADRSAASAASAVFDGRSLSATVMPRVVPIASGWPAGLALLLEAEAGTSAQLATREAPTSMCGGLPPRVVGRCTAPPGCGDGVIDPDEQCDDGNLLANDSCTSVCTLPRCGDDIVSGVEQCDDGNSNAGDGCSPACALEVCGNALLDPPEECDDGNVLGGDGCDGSCKREVTDPGGGGGP